MSEKQEISFLVNKKELELLQYTVLFMDAEAQYTIMQAKEENDKLRLKLSYDLLDEFLDYIASCANRAELKIKQGQLDNLYCRLQRLVDLSKVVKRYGKVKILSEKNISKIKVYVFDIWIHCCPN